MRKSLLTFVPAAAVLAVISLPILFGRLDVYAVHSDVAADGSLVRTARLTSVTELRKQQSAPGPKAQVDSPVHDFGRLDPLTVHEHLFVIRNIGRRAAGVDRRADDLQVHAVESGPARGAARRETQWQSAGTPGATKPMRIARPSTQMILATVPCGCRSRGMCGRYCGVCPNDSSSRGLSPAQPLPLPPWSTPKSGTKWNSSRSSRPRRA